MVWGGREGGMNAGGGDKAACKSVGKRAESERYQERESKARRAKKRKRDGR